MAVFLTFPVFAQENSQSDLLSLGLGYYDIDDSENAADFRIEYWWNRPLFWRIQPWAGLEATSDGALFAAGGVMLDLTLADKITITPSVGSGFYYDGQGKDLGNTIVFRTQLELGYKFENSNRVGVSIGHTSNASLGNPNPGTEILELYYHIPVNNLL